MNSPSEQVHVVLAPALAPVSREEEENTLTDEGTLSLSLCNSRIETFSFRAIFVALATVIREGESFVEIAVRVEHGLQSTGFINKTMRTDVPVFQCL